MIPDALRDSRVLVVDDEPANVRLLEELLRRWSLSDVISTTDSSLVVELCAIREPDLIMLDLHMPSPDGFEVMSQLMPWTHSPTPIPVLMLTAEASPEVKRRALGLGVRDFVAKPFDFEEIRLRTVNLLETRRLQRDLWRHHQLLEDRIRERTRDLDRARRDVLERLARAAEFRDDDTGEHTRRVGRTSQLIGRELGLPDDSVDQLAAAAPLHDVGKIGIPDSILLKPGKLTTGEFEVIKRHVKIGARLLEESGSSVLDTACTIALTHHERWDGGGYSNGLAGEAIPIAGRIVAVADVFDALTHERPYKEAWSVDQAVETVLEESGGAFDPSVVEAFCRLDHDALLSPAPAPGPPRYERPELTVTLARAGAATNGNTASAMTQEAVEPAHVTDHAHDDVAPEDARRIVRGGRGFSAGSVRVTLPPNEPLLPLAELLSQRGKKIHELAARDLYEGEPRGWFLSEEATRLVGDWTHTLAAAARGGLYGAALDATLMLTGAAEASGATLLERYTYMERFAARATRMLEQGDESTRAELITARRLFSTLRQLLLEEVSAA
jgi:putative two-component system response regulator